MDNLLKEHYDSKGVTKEEITNTIEELRAIAIIIDQLTEANTIRETSLEVPLLRMVIRLRDVAEKMS